MGTVGRQHPGDDEELDRLPPLDGDATDAPEAPVAADDDLDASDDEGGLDDSTPASEGRTLDHLGIDAVDLDDLAEPRSTEQGWLEEASDNQEVDIGGYDLVEGGLDPSGELRRRSDPSLGGDEGEATPEPDEDFSAGERAGALDPAAEDGPVDADEELREDDLPALDADEQDSGGDEASLLDDRLARGESHEPVGLPWSATPWARVGAPVGLRGVTALGCAARGALVAWAPEGHDSSLVQVDLEGTKRAVGADGLGPGGVRRIAAQGSVVVALVEGSGANGSENGRLFLSRNAAESFEALSELSDAVEVALCGAMCWVVTSTGGLVSVATPATQATDGASPAPGAAVVHHEVPGRVTALAADGAGGVAALAVDARQRPTALVRGARDGSIQWEGLELPPASPPAVPPGRTHATGEAVIAARGPFLALALGGAVFRRTGAGPWQCASWDGTVTALSFVDDAGTLLAATYSPSDSATALVGVDPSGSPAVVALVGAVPDDPDSDGRILALACDEAHGVVWLAGGFGIAAFARPTKV